MAESALLLGSCLLLLVMQSLSLCVFEDGTNSTCSSSSLLLVPISQINDNNGYSLIVDKLPNITTNCTSTNSKKEFYATMGGSILTKEFLDKDNTTVKITLPQDIGSGQHIISISYYINDPNCCKVEAVLNHEITVKVIDDPYAHHQDTDPQTIQCTVLHSDFSDMWTEFMLNDAVLGYCGHFTSPVEHKNGISIYYDTTEGVCTLKIDKLTDDNKGDYSCSVMVPYPDGNGFLRLNSTPIPISHPKNNDTTILAATIPIIFVLIVGIIIMAICCYRKPWKGKANNGGANNHGAFNRGAHNGRVNYGAVDNDGANNGGAINDGANNGGANNGGVNNGGANNGGVNNGGANNGGANNGGANNDRVNNGGANNGGANNGGANNGGANNGGANNGGANNGGVNDDGGADDGGAN